MSERMRTGTVTRPKTRRPKLHTAWPRKPVPAFGKDHAAINSAERPLRARTALRVIIVNDDFTPRDFVVTVLKFHMSEDQAYRAMITAHRNGVCVVFTRDVAEATRATDAGKAEGYPLLFTTEPEE